MLLDGILPTRRADGRGGPCAGSLDPGQRIALQPSSGAAAYAARPCPTARCSRRGRAQQHRRQRRAQGLAAALFGSTIRRSGLRWAACSPATALERERRPPRRVAAAEGRLPLHVAEERATVRDSRRCCAPMAATGASTCPGARSTRAPARGTDYSTRRAVTFAAGPGARDVHGAAARRHRDEPGRELHRRPRRRRDDRAHARGRADPRRRLAAPPVLMPTLPGSPLPPPSGSGGRRPPGRLRHPSPPVTAGTPAAPASSHPPLGVAAWQRILRRRRRRRGISCDRPATRASEGASPSAAAARVHCRGATPAESRTRS